MIDDEKNTPAPEQKQTPGGENAAVTNNLQSALQQDADPHKALENVASALSPAAIDALSFMSRINFSTIPPEKRSQELFKIFKDTSVRLIALGIPPQDVDSLTVIMASTAAGAYSDQPSSQPVDADPKQLLKTSAGELNGALKKQGFPESVTDAVVALNATIAVAAQDSELLDKIPNPTTGVRFSNLSGDARSKRIGEYINEAQSRLVKGRLGNEGTQMVRRYATANAAVIKSK